MCVAAAVLNEEPLQCSSLAHTELSLWLVSFSSNLTHKVRVAMAIYYGIQCGSGALVVISKVLLVLVFPNTMLFFFRIFTYFCLLLPFLSSSFPLPLHSRTESSLFSPIYTFYADCGEWS